MTQTENKRNIEGDVNETSKYTLLRSRFAYRIKEAEIHTNGYQRRIQEMLEQRGEFGYFPLVEATEEKFDEEKGIYVVTNTSKAKGADSFLLQVGRIDVLYPHQVSIDAGHSINAKEYKESVEIEFRMAGLKGLVTGSILIPKSDDSESKAAKIVRLGKLLEPRKDQKNDYRFLAFTGARNEDLAEKLGLSENYMETIIVPQVKIPEIYLA